VVHLLEHLRAVILQGKIVLDEDELLCAQSTLDLATASYLNNLQQQCFSLKLQLESFEDHSNVDKTYSLKVQDAHYRYSHFIQQVERLSEEITQLEEEFKEKKEQIRREQQLIENLVWIGLQRVIKVVM
jgi:chromosome segregation ATPase